jgi:hypothetical protein
MTAWHHIRSEITIFKRQQPQDEIPDTHLIGEATFDNDIALVQLQSNGTVDSSLTGGDRCGDELSLRAKEVAVVENSAEFDGDELVSKRSNVSIHRQTFEIHMRNSEDCRSGRLIASSRLDTDESVFDNVDTADTVFSGKLVQRQENFNAISEGLLSGGDFNGKTVLEFNADGFRGVRSALRRSGQFPHVSGGSGVGIFEDSSFIGNVEKILISGPRLRSGLGNRDLVLGSIIKKSSSPSKPIVELFSP